MVCKPKQRSNSNAATSHSLALIVAHAMLRLHRFNEGGASIATLKHVLNNKFHFINKEASP